MKNKKIKLPYEAPQVVSMHATDVIAVLGPAQGMSSGIVSAPGFGPDGGVDGVSAPASTRRYGSR